MAETEAKKPEEGAGDSETKDEPEKEGDAKDSAGGVNLGEKSGSSLASVVAASRLSDAASEIALEVSRECGERIVIIVEDRAVAASDIVRSQVASELEGLDSVLTGVEVLVAPIQAPPPPPPRALRDEDVESADTGGGGAETPTAAPEPPKVTDVLTQVGQIMGLFRSTFDLAPQDVTVDRTALIASVAGKLRSMSKPVIVPTMAAVEDAPLFDEARALLVRRQVVAAAVSNLEAKHEAKASELASARSHRDALVTQRAKLVAENKPDDAKKYDELISSAESAIARIADDPAFQERRARLEGAKAILAAFDKRLDDLTKPPASGSSPLVQAALREQIKELAHGKETAVLWVDVSATGGDSVKRQSPLGWNSQVSFLGAAQAVYLLVSSDGQVLVSGAQDSFGYQTFDFDEFFDASTASSRATRWLSGPAEALSVLVALVVVIVLIGWLFNQITS